MAANLDEDILRLILLHCLKDTGTNVSRAGRNKTTHRQKLNRTNRTVQDILRFGSVNKHWHKVVNTFATDPHTCCTFSIATRNCSLGFISFVARWKNCICSVEFLNPVYRSATSARLPASVVIPFTNEKYALVNALGRCTSMDALSLGTRWFTIVKVLCKCLLKVHSEVPPHVQTTSVVQSLTSLSLSRHIVEVPPEVGLLTQLAFLELRGYLIVIPPGLRCHACTRLVLRIVRDVRVQGQESFILGRHFPKLTALSYLVNRYPYRWPPQVYGHPTPVSQCHELTDLQLQLDLQCWHTVFDSSPARHLRTLRLTLSNGTFSFLDELPLLSRLDIDTKRNPRLYTHLNVALPALQRLDHVSISVPVISLFASLPQDIMALDRIPLIETFKLCYESLNIAEDLWTHLRAEGATEAVHQGACHTLTFFDHRSVGLDTE
eukprot:jgi/Botrbrau1/19734/Bobra.0878s0001.2